ncbi:MAG: 30S ribosomal protein S12 methylthiotransferase RimO [Myxococcales bacterium]|nr:30S ribosomal protein S12 methylthiotransferase RimO [Myxococcales bacterium]|tara:strand:- start:3698 stop:5122 length:1425 start_codon:yes stop_codon:yes gene_type:complete
MNDSKPIRVHLETLGCPKNQVDSELILGAFQHADHEIVANPDDADVLVVNTCGFIGEARQASIDAILELAEHKKNSPSTRLIVTGCLSQTFAPDLAEAIPEVDLFLGSGDAKNANAWLDQLPTDTDHAPPRIQVGRAGTLYDPDTPRIKMGPTHSAYVKLAEGCSQKCSFCIIPRLRGKAKSRTIDTIVAEVEGLAQSGVREFNLIAQDLTHYGNDQKDDGQTSLAHLLDRLVAIPDVRWLRLMYCYPHGIGPELLEHLKPGGKVVPYMDMPLQHIDNDVLNAMQRRFSEQETRALLDEIREADPTIFLRTTFLVGFPGETIAQSNRLKTFAAEFGFDHAGAFAYSYEDLTPSGKRSDQITDRTRQRRADRLGEVLRDGSERRAHQRMGEFHEAVIESVSEQPGLYLGRHWGQAPEIDGCTYLHWDGPALEPGTFVRVEFVSVSELDMVAQVHEVLERPKAREQQLSVFPMMSE